MSLPLPNESDAWQVQGGENGHEFTSALWNHVLGQIKARLEALQLDYTNAEELANNGIEQVQATILAATSGPLQQLIDDIAEAQGQLDQILTQGVPAANVQESAERVFVSAEQREAIGANAQALISAKRSIRARAFFLASTM
ncbi:hypothetical protein [Pararhizobium haloflavum]|uniref:hypothetical protein n=1 Tax=Pararhizobium haloflavum TaxID=2037914 RepID=UPI0012FFD9B3|nr:hypothetical protein [Pararhizobium haloflavum]